MTQDIKPVPFDAHEQIVRGPHTHSQAEGYKALDEDAAEDAITEFPKAVTIGEGEEAKTVVVKDAKEEAALTAKSEKAV